MAKRQPASRPLRPDAHERALDALAIARREEVSLTEAARRVRSDRRTVLRHAGSAFRKEGRRYKPRAFDRMPREVALLQADGPRYVTVRDSRTATALADQANAVQQYVARGDDSGLKALGRRTVRVNGTAYRLYLAPAEIDRLAMGGELHYELYRR